MAESAAPELGHPYRAREARDHFKDVLDAAERGDVAVVVRDAPMVVLRRDVYDSLLKSAARFRVRSSVREGQVSFWMDDVPVHATGATLDEAEGAFLDALIDYADLWQKELRHAPNHKQNADLVRRITIYAGDRDQLSRVVFDDDDE